jgi:cathepsin L
MKLLVLAALLACAVAVPVFTEDEVNVQWLAWKGRHRAIFEPEVEGLRRAAFKDNLHKVAAHNEKYAKGEETYTLTAMGPFAHLTEKEYKQQLLSSSPKKAEAQWTMTASDGDAPDSWDWRDKAGIVGKVKNQQQCGSCWAFSAVATMEGRYALDSGKHESFSEQELVDCVKGGACTCDEGGEMHDGIVEIVQNHNGKINTEQQYPYTAQSLGVCKADDKDAIDAGFTGYANVTSGDEDALKVAAYQRPVISVGIDASSFGFQLYSGGVYYNKHCMKDWQDLDHGVAVVGYGSEDGKDFWWVRNSWGEGWGLSGYIKMSRNRSNNCGVSTDATFALSHAAP